MAEYGNPFGVDRLLDLSTMGQEYTNMRMGRANALRGLTKLGAVSAPNTQLAVNLRGLGTATHKDIAARLTDRMLGQRLDNEDQFRGRWDLLFGEDYNEFYDEVIKNWREQVRLGISQASEERAIRDQAIQELELAQKQKLWPLDEGMIAVVKRAAENDIQAIRDGKKYHAVVRDRLTNKSAGWEKSHSDYYKSLMEMAGQKPDPTEIARIAKLAEDEATQYVVDMTIRGVESGMSIEGAYNNAVSAVRSGAVAGKFNDVEAVRRLKARGHDVMPPATEWVFDLDEQKPVKISERKRRQNPDKYGPPLSSVSGKLSENFFIAGMEMLMADIANPEQVNPMTFDLLVFYNTNGLVKLRKEDVAVMGRWSAAAQALKSASAPSTMSQMEALRLQIKQQQGAATEEDDDLQE